MQFTITNRKNSLNHYFYCYTTQRSLCKNWLPQLSWVYAFWCVLVSEPPQTSVSMWNHCSLVPHLKNCKEERLDILCRPSCSLLLRRLPRSFKMLFDWHDLSPIKFGIIDTRNVTGSNTNLAQYVRMQLFLQQMVYFCNVVWTDNKSVTYFPFIFNTSNDNSGVSNRDGEAGRERVSFPAFFREKAAY